MKFLKHLDRCIAQILIWFIVYSRPLFGPARVCPFPLGCTEFAIKQLQDQSVGYAVATIVLRLLKCNPIYLAMRKS